jgi:uncharacterized protein
MVLIDVNGDIWPCHRWSKRDEWEWRFGSIYDGTFNYSSRQLINDIEYKMRVSECRKCDANFFCLGGCLAENLEDTGSMWRQHRIGCKLFKIIAGLIKEFHNILLAEKNSVFIKYYYGRKKESAQPYN